MSSSAGMMRPPLIPTAAKILAFRKQKDWTQLDASLATGVPLATWQGWEQDRFTPSVPWIRLLQRNFSDFPR